MPSAPRTSGAVRTLADARLQRQPTPSHTRRPRKLSAAAECDVPASPAPSFQRQAMPSYQRAPAPGYHAAGRELRTLAHAELPAPGQPVVRSEPRQHAELSGTEQVVRTCAQRPAAGAVVRASGTATARRRWRHYAAPRGGFGSAGRRWWTPSSLTHPRDGRGRDVPAPPHRIPTDGHLRRPLRPPRRNRGSVRAGGLAGIASGLVFAFADDLPQISALDDYAPSTITRVQAIGGEVVGEFATQRRGSSAMTTSPFVAAGVDRREDAGLDQHLGSVCRAWSSPPSRDMMTGRRAGASTLTQQLARNLFPDTIGFRKTPERKIKEALVTIQIEKRYTKWEIFTLLPQSRVPRTRRVRRGIRRSSLFQQARERPDARRGGDDCRTRATARASKPVR